MPFTVKVLSNIAKSLSGLVVSTLVPCITNLSVLPIVPAVVIVPKVSGMGSLPSSSLIVTANEPSIATASLPSEALVTTSALLPVPLPSSNSTIELSRSEVFIVLTNRHLIPIETTLS